MTTAAAIPAPALWLGVFGLAPFLGLAGAAVLLDGDHASLAQRALIAYGATILSFLGGIHWGFALREPAAAKERLAGVLAVGVAPQLLGWASLLAPHPAGLWLVAVAILAFVLADRRLATEALAPAWFIRLRAPLSISAALCLAAGTFAP